MKKEDILVLFFGFVYIFLGMFPLSRAYFSKPKERVYTWLEGGSEDYIGYVSYIKEGMYGRNFVVLRSVPIENQKPTTIHILYIFIGKVGRIFHLSAPVAFHVARIVIGLSFIYITFRFFVFSLGSKTRALVTTIMAFLASSLGWYSYNKGTWAYQDLAHFDFYVTMVLRAISRPHYEFGALVFLLVGMILFSSSLEIKKRIVGGFFLAVVLGIVHSVFSFLFMLTFLSLIFFKLCFNRPKPIDIPLYIAIFSGLVLGFSLSFLGSLGQYWTEVYRSTNLLTIDQIWRYILAFGPTLWLGYIGLIVAIIKTRGKKDSYMFLFLWLSIQLMLFLFVGSLIHADPVRFIQSLYFIPMAWGTAYLLQNIKNNIHLRWWMVGMVVIILLSVPTYIKDFLMYFAHAGNTDYRVYSSFVYPSKNMVSAYRFLDENTPVESIVLAKYEATNNMLMYNHNVVLGQVGHTSEEITAIEKDRQDFFVGAMSFDGMSRYLHRNNIRYIYVGYQERFSDIFERNPQLFKPIFSNSEVTIYAVQ